MKKITVLTFLFTSFLASAGSDFGLKFDNTTGLLIKPDEQFLAWGLKDDKKGRNDGALKNFMKAAEYGNLVAMSMVGWYELKDKNYIESLAWLHMIDVDKLPNKSHAVEMITKLEAYLRPDEMEKVKARKSELMETYGALPTLMKRQHWKDNIKVTGSRNKGKIPMTASFSLKGGIIVDGASARDQVDSFVYDYKFSDEDGRVTLSQLEEIDE